MGRSLLGRRGLLFPGAQRLPVALDTIRVAFDTIRECEQYTCLRTLLNRSCPSAAPHAVGDSLGGRIPRSHNGSVQTGSCTSCSRFLGSAPLFGDVACCHCVRLVQCSSTRLKSSVAESLRTESLPCVDMKHARDSCLPSSDMNGKEQRSEE